MLPSPRLVLSLFALASLSTAPLSFAQTPEAIDAIRVDTVSERMGDDFVARPVVSIAGKSAVSASINRSVQETIDTLRADARGCDQPAPDDVPLTNHLKISFEADSGGADADKLNLLITIETYCATAADISVPSSVNRVGVAYDTKDGSSREYY